MANNNSISENKKYETNCLLKSGTPHNHTSRMTNYAQRAHLYFSVMHFYYAVATTIAATCLGKRMTCSRFKHFFVCRSSCLVAFFFSNAMLSLHRYPIASNAHCRGMAKCTCFTSTIQSTSQDKPHGASLYTPAGPKQGPKARGGMMDKSGTKLTQGGLGERERERERDTRHTHAHTHTL